MRLYEVLLCRRYAEGLPERLGRDNSPGCLEVHRYLYEWGNKCSTNYKYNYLSLTLLISTHEPQSEKCTYELLVSSLITGFESLGPWVV